MKIVIDVQEERYKEIQRIAEVQLDFNQFQTTEQIIANGMVLDERWIPVSERFQKKPVVA